jgi:hypothetical protein
MVSKNQKFLSLMTRWVVGRNNSLDSIKILNIIYVIVTTVS